MVCHAVSLLLCVWYLCLADTVDVRPRNHNLDAHTHGLLYVRLVLIVCEGTLHTQSQTLTRKGAHSLTTAELTHGLSLLEIAGYFVFGFCAVHGHCASKVNRRRKAKPRNVRVWWRKCANRVRMAGLNPCARTSKTSVPRCVVVLLFLSFHFTRLRCSAFLLADVQTQHVGRSYVCTTVWSNGCRTAKLTSAGGFPRNANRKVKLKTRCAVNLLLR